MNSGEHQSVTTVAWDAFPECLRVSFRRAGWALVNLPTPEELLERAWTQRVKWVSAATMVKVVTDWRGLAAWLAGRGIRRLDEVTADGLDEYAAHLTGLGQRRRRTADILATISLLWGFAPHLPPGDRIPMPPWDEAGLRDYLPLDDAVNENTTQPIHPAVMSPLLIWATRFVEDFAADILSAWRERQALLSQIPGQPAPEGTRRLRELLAEYRAEGRALPGSIYLGRHLLARAYLAAVTGATRPQAKVAIRDYGRDLPVSTETPLAAPVRGLLHGKPWKDHIDFHEAPVLMHRLAAAAMVVISYLSGMRPAEVLNLRAGCCPEPADDGHSSIRYEIHGNFFKGARDDDGKTVTGGLARQTPWTVILPVVRAIRVLEQMAEGDLLFPVRTPWAKPTRGNRSRPGEALACEGARHRIRAFAAWVNDYTDQAALPSERIPADPHGDLVLSRYRRTIAWHIARLPGGRIALATQYGRARHGLRRVLDIETARAMADYLDDIAARVDAGEGVSGPAASRMIKAARDAAARFEGMFLTPRQADALLAEPQFNVYDNPEAFLTCNNDPAKAMCHPDRTRNSARARPPATGRCDPACANIARTDTHMASLRDEIAQLADEVTSPLTPVPLRERLTQRISALQAIVDRHEQTRIVPASRKAAR